MNVLVTGANGFIGSNLTQLLLREGHSVKAMVLPGTDLSNLDGLNCEIVYADITKQETLHDLLNGVEVVFHLAALPSLAWNNDIIKVNYGGTWNLILEAIKSKVRRLVYMSSLVVHGFDSFENADEDTPLMNPGLFTRPYISSKVKCEELLEMYKDKIETVIIRPGFNIYGPNDRMTSKEMLQRLENGHLMGYVNDGESKLGYVYAENLAYGLLCAGVSPNAAGNTYIIADYEPPYLHLKNLLELFSKELNIKAKLTAVPSFLFMPLGFIMDVIHFLLLRKRMPLISTYIVNTSTHDLHFSSAKAQREIGYKQLVSFEEGIKRTVAWYKKQKTK
jgi:nucleoside-diphosphate-sugar epimerase